MPGVQRSEHGGLPWKLLVACYIWKKSHQIALQRKGAVLMEKFRRARRNRVLKEQERSFKELAAAGDIQTACCAQEARRTKKQMEADGGEALRGRSLIKENGIHADDASGDRAEMKESTEPRHSLKKVVEAVKEEEHKREESASSPVSMESEESATPEIEAEAEEEIPAPKEEHVEEAVNGGWEEQAQEKSTEAALAVPEAEPTPEDDKPKAPRSDAEMSHQQKEAALHNAPAQAAAPQKARQTGQATDTPQAAPVPAAPHDQHEEVPDYVDMLPPTARDVSVCGDFKEGATLIASYRYEGGKEGRSECAWYSFADEDGLGELIPGSYGQMEYTLRPQDVGRHVAFQCTPVRSDGKRGEVHEFFGSTKVEGDPPTVTGVTIVGLPVVNRRLVGKGIYAGGKEGTSRYKWLREREGVLEPATKPNDGAEYLVSQADLGAQLRFEYVPVNAAGVEGEAQSTYTAPVKQGLTGPFAREALLLQERKMERSLREAEVFRMWVEIRDNVAKKRQPDVVDRGHNNVSHICSKVEQSLGG